MSSKNVRSFDCISSRNGKILLLSVISVIFIGYGIFTLFIFGFDTENLNVKDILLISVGLISLILAILVFVNQKDCYIAVKTDCICGLKPAFPCKAKYFGISYYDIIKIYDLIVPISKVPPVALIKTSKKFHIISCLEKDELSFLVSFAKSKISSINKEGGSQ